MSAVSCTQRYTHVGAQTKAAAIISYKMKICMFWRDGVLDYGDLRVLLNTVFFYVGLYFAFVEDMQEQIDLSFQQFTRVPAEDSVYKSNTYCEHVEIVFKKSTSI